MVTPARMDRWLFLRQERFLEGLASLHALAQAAPVALVLVALLQVPGLWDVVTFESPGLLPFLKSTKELWIPLLFLGLTTPLISPRRIEFAAGFSLFLVLGWAGWLESPWRGPWLGAAFAGLIAAALFRALAIGRIGRGTALMAFFFAFAAAINAFIPDETKGLWTKLAPLSYLLFAFGQMDRGRIRDLHPARALNPGHFLGAMPFPRMNRGHGIDPVLWTRGWWTALKGLAFLIVGLQFFAQGWGLLAGIMSFLAGAGIGAGLARMYGADIPDPIRAPWFARDPVDFIRRAFFFEFTWGRQNLSRAALRLFRSRRMAVMIPVAISTLLAAARFPEIAVRFGSMALVLLAAQEIWARLPSRAGFRWLKWIATQILVWGTWVALGFVL